MFSNNSWQLTYESGTDDLFTDFYEPFLSEAEQYNRIAGYLSLRGLAAALEGVDSMLETDGEIRVITGADLQQREREYLLTDTEGTFPNWTKSQLAIIAELFDRGDLSIKVADVSQQTGMFHSKLGIGVDANDDVLTFEGSINETPNGWLRSYERFKIHRSWKYVEREYVERDRETFDMLWNDNHSYVDVYELSEADKQDIASWQPDGGQQLQKARETVREGRPENAPSEWELARALSVNGQTPGGLHLAEDVSTITPWPHQRSISDTVVSHYPSNFILSDEVGLGKTIEVGLTLSRLIQTGDVETALLLVPASLMEQWQRELRDKFNLNAYRFERQSGYPVVTGSYGDGSSSTVTLSGDVTASDWSDTPIGGFVDKRDRPTIIIQSWHRARMTGNQQHVAPQTDETVWDATVVDEAHNARNPDTKFYKLLGDVRDSSRALYALSATPMQVRIEELHDILRLTELPDSWDDRKQLANFFRTKMILRETLAEGRIGDSFGDIEREIERTFQRKYADRFDESRHSHIENDLSLEVVRARFEQFARMIADHAASYPGYTDYIDQLADTIETDEGMRVRFSLRKQLKRLIDSDERRFVDDPAEILYDLDDKLGWRLVVRMSEDMNPVQSRMFRNTREVLRDAKEDGRLDATVPRRDVSTEHVPLDNEIEELFDEIESYIKNTYQRSTEVLDDQQKAALGFVMTIYRKRLASSFAAIQSTLRSRYNSLGDKLPDDADELESQVRGSEASEADVRAIVDDETINQYQVSKRKIIQYEQSQIEQFITKLRSQKTDPKVSKLSSAIDEYREEGYHDIVIFTQYTDTMDDIANELKLLNDVGIFSGDGGSVYRNHEWVDVGKEGVKKSFADDDGIGILVCTDSASEGLNLQTGELLINYDLPWNPMQVEQRIGRIDRIGQENEVVKIVNYAYEDEIDAQIYESLDDKLDIFDQVVGDTRPVLAGIESEIRDIALKEDTETIEQLTKEKARDADEMSNTMAAVGLTDVEYDTEAALVGWGERTHSALNRIGSDARRFDPVLTPSIVEYLFTQSSSLETAGWSFQSLRNHERGHEFPEAVREAYLLSIPDESEVDYLLNQQVDSDEQTAQEVFAEQDALVVTFSTELVNERGSLRLLLPGDPLFAHLLQIIDDNQAMAEENVTLISSNEIDEKLETNRICDVQELIAPVINNRNLTPMDINCYENEKSAKEAVKRFVYLD
ncbi:DEAD/DEAH box helicase [Haloquadratum walsbyi]|uniref:Probable DEAD/DEAH box helicase n=1 Tax=Haloquadratum walsbyi (strain DSM 16854 / JCM 12705 / C23) TaxID=768065 RepID=G0LHB0_HALWC|nr:SNF2-related protein [Haloquadratum walsbyi]CCC40144.1 probable DEAD/DEAH box helicase [Haloquadratum walsbyi C23]